MTACNERVYHIAAQACRLIHAAGAAAALQALASVFTVGLAGWRGAICRASGKPHRRIMLYIVTPSVIICPGVMAGASVASVI